MHPRPASDKLSVLSPCPAILILALPSLAAALVGCSGDPPPAAPDDPAGSARLEAFAHEDEQPDFADLVNSLRSDEPIVRSAAFRTLREHTGQTFGFDPFASDEERDRAAARWEAWLEERTQGANTSGGSAGGSPPDGPRVQVAQPPTDLNARGRRS